MSTLLDELRAQLAGTYRIDRELGGGGMSRVFVAEEVALGRRVVLKVLEPDLAHVISAERFQREIRVAAQLQHPHVVPLLSAGRAGDALYYTMPLVEGESLRMRLDQHGELPVVEAARLFREVADALSYAHRQGVVHRDIKPENILLSHHHGMVTDFGVARAVSQAAGATTLTHTGMAVGTPAYMAPEQAAASPIDHRADIYALGLVAYEMLAGEPPFHGATAQALVAAHMTQAPRPLTEARPSVPRDLAAIVHRCLEKRPADRYEDAAGLVAALDRVRESAQPERVSMSRRTLLVSGAALGVAAAGLVGGAALLLPRERGTPRYQRLTFRRGMIRTARFGPDHQTVLYGACWDGDACRVYTVRPDSPESAPLALPAAAPLAVSASGELALALGEHRRGIMPYGTLARVALSGGAPRELLEDVKYADWSPDGASLAVIRRVGQRDQLEFPIGSAVAVPETHGGGFSFVRVSPRGDAAAAFELLERDGLSGRVVIVDRRGAVRATSDRYFNLFGLAWHGDEVWFTAAGELPLFRNDVSAMTQSGRVRRVASVPGNTSLHDIAPDGRVLVARTDDRSGIAVRAPGEARERDLSWLDGTSLADISRDGRQVLFHEYGVGGGPHGSTYLRGTDGTAAIRLGEGLARALSPDARRAILQGVGAPHLEVVPTGAGQSTRIVRSGLALGPARWHPDGVHVVVRGRGAGGGARLYLLEVDGSGTRPLTPEGIDVADGEWALSPDGASLALSTGAGIDIIALGGGATRPVPGAVRGSRVVEWVTGGVLVADDPAADGRVHVVHPDTGHKAVWTEIVPQDPAGIMSMDLRSLVATPDGRGYGYSWHRAMSDLYLVDGWT